MFVNEFATAKMVCMVENIFEDGEWAIMEWKDSLGPVSYTHLDVYKRQGCKDLNEYLQKRIADRKEQAQSVEKRNDTLSKDVYKRQNSLCPTPMM